MERWSREKAAAWMAAQPWPVGANFLPSDAVNDIAMWMDATFSPDLIRRELGWAAQTGMNTVRVFLAYTVWEHEPQAFPANLDRFLDITAGQGIRVMPVLFDDCAFDRGADPVYGPQPEPKKGVHNGRWVPSPGAAAQDDPARAVSLAAYVDTVVGAHRDDPRILAWDLFNEPGNGGRGLASLPLLVTAFRRARAQNPSQPLTAAVWDHAPEQAGMNRVIADLSDIVSLHAYGSPEETRRLVLEAEAAYGRPVFVTEWMNRVTGNTYEALLPFFRERKTGIWQWGLVNGKTQTHLTWDSWKTPEREPEVWFHDLLRRDGTPFDPEEVRLIRSLTGRG